MNNRKKDKDQSYIRGVFVHRPGSNAFVVLSGSNIQSVNFRP